MRKIYGDLAHSLAGGLAHSKVHKRFKQFKNGRGDFNDGEKLSRLQGNNRVELSEVNSSTTTMWRILTDDLVKRNLCVCFLEHHFNS